MSTKSIAGRIVTGIAVIMLTASLSYGESPSRIVSLAPSVTAMLYALGVEDRLAGVTIFCDYPPEAKEKPRIGGMSNPSLEAVVSLRPDLVIMTTDGNPQAVNPRLKEMGIETYVLRERRVDEVPAGLRALGRVVGAEERATVLAAEIEEDIEAYRRARPFSGRALFIVWPEPLVVAGPGTLIDDVLSLLGFENIAAQSPANYPKYSVEEILWQNPEYIFIGLGMESGQSEMTELSGRLLQKLKSTHARREGNVYFVSDHLYRFGPRIMLGIEEMKAVVKGGAGDR
jgi:iron complex transport system substrate-binding protein